MDVFLDKVKRESSSLNPDPDVEPPVEKEKSELELGSRNASPKNQKKAAEVAAAFSTEDVELCQRLDEEYERALEEREIGYNARYASVRQSAMISVFFMISFLLLGTAFFIRQADWTIADSLLFSIYTITTVGYGNHEIPTGPGFQAYTIFYILIGIAALTIMVAQVYMCIALEASRAQIRRDRTRHSDVVSRGTQPAHENSHSSHGQDRSHEIIAFHTDNLPNWIDQLFRVLERAKTFFQENEIGRGISVLFPFAGLIAIGAIVVGPIEGWTFLESVYFAVVSLTTVGFGDYFPTRTASIWFCILWLPFSIGFMSLFLGSVASFYIRLSDRNIERIERRMRRRLQQAKEKAELERAEVLKRAYRGQEIKIENITIRSADNKSDASDDDLSSPQKSTDPLTRKKKKRGFDVLPGDEGSCDTGDSDTKSWYGLSLSDKGNLRRQRIVENSAAADVSRAGSRNMQSMRDIVAAVRSNLSAKVGKTSEHSRLISIRSTETITTSHGLVGLRRSTTRKPSFGLRVLVQERFAEIIATEIAGFQNTIDIQENTLSVTIDRLKSTADKWAIPRRARKAFRSVSFEVLYFVGERGLVTRGADALMDLTPVEFHSLFSSLVAAMGDADSMEGWLATTNVLADVDLHRNSNAVTATPSSAEERTLQQLQSQLADVQEEDNPSV
eukprot:scaffold1319_cov126-Cylindrotheca_fusiformis.AAC.22